jgi:hypothetical protein
MGSQTVNKNRNPLNIKNDPKHPWKGSIGTDSRGHAVFEREADGLRAAVRSLAAKYAAGKKTLLAIISSWAPASDTIGSIKGNAPNSPREYATFCARWLGIGVEVDARLFDSRGAPQDIERLVVLVDAMNSFENGLDSKLATSTILEGIALYLRDFVEAKG